MSTHITFVERHCRVCCKVLGKQKYQCSHHESLLMSLGVDLSSDSPEIHPQYFCNYCYLSAKKQMCGQQSCTTLSPTQWLPHSETSCTVCDVKRKGGRPKKKSSSGRPSAMSTHIKSVASPIPPFTLDQLVHNSYKDDVTCRSCKAAVQKPVEVLPCKSLYCCNCALSLASSSSFTCSSCSCIHESIDSTFTKPSSIAEKMILGLCVKCNSCGMNVKVELLEADCHTHKKSHREDLNKAVSELLPQSHQTITVSTGGRVSAYVVYIVLILLLAN